MPYVNIKMVRTARATPEQKRRLIEGTTALMSEVLGVDPKATTVVIDELESDNWGVGGESLTARWEREKGRAVNV